MRFDDAPRILLVSLALAAAGCSSSRTDVSAAEIDARPNYHEDVRPILTAHCVECHHSSGSVTEMVKLGNYEEAKAVAPIIAHAVREHEMPLWGVDNSGACKEWKNPRWLEPHEREILERWNDIGAPLGDPAKAAPFGAPRHVTQKLRHVDATLDPGREYTPTIGAGVVRCFVVDPALATDRLVTGLEVVPARPWSVQQVTLFSLDSAEAELAADGLDREDDVPGYECLAGPRVAASQLLAGSSWIDAGSTSWVTRMPDGLGLRAKGGRKLVMQVHYNVISGMLPDRSVVRLELEDDAREACWLPVQATPFVLEPGRELVSAQAFSSPPRDADVFGVYPRMRLRGESMRVEANRSCIADVYRWDAHGLQHLYLYEQPFPLVRTDNVHISCRYTTLGRDKPVVNGDGPEDEECTMYLLVSPC